MSMLAHGGTELAGVEPGHFCLWGRLTRPPDPLLPIPSPGGYGMEVKYAGRTFVKNKFDGLDGKTKVSFQEIGDGSSFKVLIDQTGVKFAGDMAMPICDQQELQGFAKFLSDCWTEHRRLVPKIYTSLNEHT